MTETDAKIARARKREIQNEIVRERNTERRQRQTTRKANRQAGMQQADIHTYVYPQHHHRHFG